jgi:hypothetical protein
MDALFTEAIAKITKLIEVTKALKAHYDGTGKLGDEELKAKQAEKKNLSGEVQAQLEKINAELGAPAADSDAAAAAAAAAPPAAAAPGGTAGGGLKRAKKAAGKPKRAQKGGNTAAVAESSVVSPAVYNIQGLMTQSHNPYLVANDANIAAMSRIHTPFSAGVVGEMNQQTTTELPTALIGRMTPQPPMSGGAKRKTKTVATKKK